jgi:hypothetical protein
VDQPDLGGQGLVLFAVHRTDSTTDVMVDERVRLPEADYEVAGGVASFRRVQQGATQSGRLRGCGDGGDQFVGT